MIDLTVYDEVYEEAKVENNDYEKIADGSYNVIVDKIDLKETKTSKTPMLTWQMKIIAGKHTGRVLFKNAVIGSVENLKYIKQDLHICGLKLDKFSDLANEKNNLIGIQLQVTLKTKGDNQNIYINKSIDETPFDADDIF